MKTFMHRQKKKTVRKISSKICIKFYFLPDLHIYIYINIHTFIIFKHDRYLFSGFNATKENMKKCILFFFTKFSFNINNERLD